MSRAGRAVLALALVVAAPLTACSDDDDDDAAPAVADALCGVAASEAPIQPDDVADVDHSGERITLLTHDSFALSDGVLDAFTAETGIEVDLLTGGDAGAMVGQAVLTTGDPVADVMYGIDNTLLCRGLEADLFVPYESPRLADVAAELRTDPEHRVTPVDFGDVCLNVDLARFAPADPDGPPLPDDLDDLLDPAYRDMLVVEDPQTSSPGLAFLLATIATYGDDGWEDWWSGVRDNGVTVVAGWEEAYTGEFSASGTGDRPIVVSYASSPPVEVLYADPPVDDAPTASVLASCYRQIEYAGVLRGTEHAEAAAALVDFLLSTQVQEDLPLSMFVWPARADAALPEIFTEYAELAAEPIQLEPGEVEARRDEWTERWVELVLR
jgi:thiamine transport system substrate-binding protein